MRCTDPRGLALALIALAGTANAVDAATVRVLGPYERVVLLGTELTRSVKPPASTDVPAGRMIAVGYDKQGEVAAVSCPFDAVDGRPLEVTVAPPAAGADVVVLLRGHDVAGVLPILTGESTETRPDAVIATADELTAVWYGIEYRQAMLSVNSHTSFLQPLDLRPRHRSVTAVRGELRTLPSLRVRIEAKGELALDALKNGHLRVKEEGHDVIRENDLRGEQDIRIAALKPAIYRIELALPEWTASVRADLTAGEDFDATFDVEPISITGRITQAAQPARAHVTIRGGKNLPTATTDAHGDYALRVWSPGRYQLEVAPTEPAATQPHLDMLVITGDRTVNVDLPANRLSLRIVDAATAKPIAGARATVTSSWTDPVQGRRRTTRPVSADADGVALLPPFYPGEVIVRAFADGYFDGEPLTIPIAAAARPEQRQIEIAMRRDREHIVLSLLLPNGAPAAGAEVIALRDLFSPNAMLWKDRADDEGRARIPSSIQSAFLAARHERAGGAIRASPSQAGAPWILPAAAEPLVVLARTRTGDAVAATAVSGWIGDLRVGGDALAFLAWSMPVTDGDGMWQARNLPAAPMRLLIGARTAGGAHDALAATIRYPWNSVQVVTAID